jgi:predicted  nucleic acid-binding Zn-ribbon protein
MAGSVLADEILETMEKVDQLEVNAGEVKTRLEAGKNDLAKFRDNVASEGRLIAGDISRLEAELVEAEKRLPGEFREDYRRVIRGKGAEGMAKMEAGVCEGCGQKVTLNMQNHLLLGMAVFCTSCGRLLYTAER